MPDQTETDFATELHNLVAAALEADIDEDEIMAALNEVLEELEARANGEDSEEDSSP